MEDDMIERVAEALWVKSRSRKKRLNKTTGSKVTDWFCDAWERRSGFGDWLFDLASGPLGILILPNLIIALTLINAAFWICFLRFLYLALS